ncbi:MAG: hypothetical protein EXS05_00205 [Planctomycetaceae bacterium]|nr:hypothetical protein [Planctomycetaceae bacterium]
MEADTTPRPAHALLPELEPPAPGGLAAATRRWLYHLVIMVAAAQGFASLVTATVLYSPAAGRWPENRPPYTPMFSANDKSRWCTVWSLAEQGTYQIDDIIKQPGWDTIDKVRYHDHFYSSKPPMLSTLVAGLYGVLKRVAGVDLVTDTHSAVRTILLIVNWLPWIVALGLLAEMVERYGRTDWSRLLVIIAAASATFLTTFLITFNNHNVAACSLVFALSPALRILIDGRREWWRFALAGFWGAFVVCNELPACAFGAGLFVWLVRRAPGPTLKFFVPAALIPLGGFFLTNWFCTGGLMPFYASFGSATNDYYKYIVDGIPSYWMNPSAIDRGESSAWFYFLNCTIGHHGIFSLSPLFLLTLAGWLTCWRKSAAALRGVSILGGVLTVWILAFYLLQTQSYNYGGMTSGLRWSFWLIPLWLLGLVPVLDDWGGRPAVRVLSAALLAVSVFSVTYPRNNPWQAPWLQQSLPTTTTIVEGPAPTTQSLWFDLPAAEQTDWENYWIEFEAVGQGGGQHRMRLALAGPPEDAGCRVAVSTADGPLGDVPPWVLGLSRAQIDQRAAPKKILVDSSTARPEALRFLAGLPVHRPFESDRVRYLKTSLRSDAFQCRIAVASVTYRPRKDGPALRYRRAVWWSPEVPFGVLQIEDTVSDPRDHSVVFRQLFKVTRTGKRGASAP